jgi:hypothetical protein
MSKKATKIEYEKKLGNVWKYWDGSAHVGQFTSRGDARKARQQFLDAKSKPAEDTPVNRAVDKIKFTETPGASNVDLHPAGTQAQLVNQGGSRMATLKQRAVNKNGLIAYQEDGVKASVYFNRTMFKNPDQPPAELTISGEGLAEPGDATARATKARSPEQLAKLQQRLEKQEAAAAKAAQRLAKSRERAKKLGIGVAEQEAVEA